ncbi:MAG: Fe-S cluster assembly protein SufD [Geodermatophilaceae bacterium]|nr:Fe-S cluster assembly protein SufD [Geodermatophilaceae bacterium]
MSAPETTRTTEATAPAGELASELFAPGVGAQAGPPPGSHSHGGRPRTGSPVQRLTSTDPDDFGAPTGREEQWRFTPMRTIRPLLNGAESDARLEWETDLPVGVEMLTAAADDPLMKTLPEPVDRLAALARVRCGGAVVVRVAEDAHLDRPVTVELKGTGSDEVVWGQVVVDVGRFAQGTIVLRHTGKARYAGGVAVLAGDGANVTVVLVQDWARGTLHGGQLDTVVGRDATVKQVVVTLGGELVRLVSNVHYAAPGGSAELLGLYFADSGQHQEHRLWVNHSVPDCRSRVEYRGALQGEGAHSVWVGDVVIRAGATGTDTYELNRNLLLTEGARADSVPNLEIETGEIVGAGHASATGRFDDEQLFYLQSRGIPAEAARRLVVRGFFAALLARIGDPAISDPLMASVEARLGDAPDNSAPESSSPNSTAPNSTATNEEN